MLITAVVGGGVKNTLRDHTSMQTGYMDGITFNSFMLCVAAGSFLFFSFIFRVPHLGATRVPRDQNPTAPDRPPTTRRWDAIPMASPAPMVKTSTRRGHGAARIGAS